MTRTQPIPVATVNSKFLRQRWIFFLVAGIFCTFAFAKGVDEQGTFTLKPNFSIEGSNQIETLTFISGISYGLSGTNKILRSQNEPPIFCTESGGNLITSKYLLDILNEEFSEGDYSADEVVDVLLQGLKEDGLCTPCQGNDDD